MKRKKWVILGIGLAVFGVYAVMTGGLQLLGVDLLGTLYDRFRVG